MGFGLAFVLLATLGWGVGDVLARKAALHAPTGVVVVGMTAVVAVTLGLAALVTQGPSAFAAVPWYFYFFVALMGLFSYAGGQLVYLMGMQRAGVTVAAPIIGATPLIAVAFAVVLGGERPNVQTVLGAFIIVAGITLVMTDRNRVLK